MMEHLGSQQDRDVTALAHRAASLLGCGVDSIDRVRGGGNNALFQLKTVRGFFALKRYMESVGDDRDRIGHEYDGLAFLAEAGELAVPRPVAVDRQEKIAIFEWLDGSSVTSVHENDIPAALAFLGRLHEYGRLAAAVNRPAAVEACLDAGALQAQIARRFEQLEKVSLCEPLLAEFLTARFRPAWHRLQQACGPDADVSPHHRTLSPSDFGTHNMLRRPDGSLAFLDFEYFGWDDPVKLVADAVWHPGSGLNPREREQFTQGARRIYAGDPDYVNRFARREPYFTLRWALIVLSEFIPERWKRRRAAGQLEDWDTIKARQLAKAAAYVEFSLR